MATDSARTAIGLSGTVVGSYPVKVLPSKTAILPVNPTFLPKVWRFVISSYTGIFIFSVQKFSW